MRYRVRRFCLPTQSVEDAIVDAASATAAAGPPRADSVLLSVSPERRWPAVPRGPRFDVAAWCRALRTLLVAGMTVSEALEALQAQAGGSRSADAQAAPSMALLGALRRGCALSAAMAQVGSFPPVLVAGVRGSERSGALVAALDDYLRYDEVLDRLRRQVVSAAIYPALVLGLGTLIVLFLLVFVIPRFAGLYGDHPEAVSLPTRIVLALSRLLNAHGPVLAWLALLLVAAALASLRTAVPRRLASAATGALPWLARRIEQLRLAKLHHALAVMFRGGYALDDALRQCAGVGLDDRMGERLATARSALARGERVSSAWSRAGLADEVTRRLLAVGERGGDFDRVLATIAERHASEFSTFVERATRVVEPLLLLAVALVVGAIVVAMYMPIFDIAGRVH